MTETVNDLASLERARLHISAAMSAADEAQDTLLGARLCQCLEWVDMQLGAASMTATVFAEAVKGL